MASNINNSNEDFGELEIGEQETKLLVLTTQLPTTQVSRYLKYNYKLFFKKGKKDYFGKPSLPIMS
ncbi:hypothetical protein A2Z54_02250 [Candidatus Curtissbacteria bacterium RIFCSPHIGHO2_02_39_8]|nr:MAG: hypothetical protein A2Z54_02250 [Candidatus Curtissbacteria bacterium RIFCSPHIGHO2_02_39_8]